MSAKHSLCWKCKSPELVEHRVEPRYLRAYLSGKGVPYPLPGVKLVTVTVCDDCKAIQDDQWITKTINKKGQQ